MRDTLSVDGVHDMGGMHGFGPVPVTDDEAVFHAPWEGRVWAMAGVLLRRTTIDRFRYLIEQMPPVQYLTSSYYERWLWALERLAAEHGMLEGRGADPVTRPALVPPTPGRFAPGDQVRVANRVVPGHCRVPRYLRRQVGRVERVACVWPRPEESAATGRYGPLESVYTVVFSGRDLFGPSADHTVSADLGESDLEAP